MSFFRPKLCGCRVVCCSGLFGCSCASSRCPSGSSKACCGSSPSPCPHCVAVCRSSCLLSYCCYITPVTLCFLQPPVLCTFMACISVLAFHCSFSPGESQTCIYINYIIYRIYLVIPHVKSLTPLTGFKARLIFLMKK